MCSIYPPVTTYSSVTHSAQALQTTFTVTNHAYGNGQYIAKLSSIFGSVPENDLFAAFDDDYSTFYTENWHNYDACSNGYCSYTGGASTFYGDSNSIGGEWIQLTVPNPIILDSFHIATRQADIGRIVTAGVMLVSNDGGNTFTLIQSFTDNTIISTKIVPVTSSVPYSTFRLVVTRTGSNSWLSIATFELISADFVTE